MYNDYFLYTYQQFCHSSVERWRINLFCWQYHYMVSNGIHFEINCFIFLLRKYLSQNLLIQWNFQELPLNLCNCSIVWNKYCIGFFKKHLNNSWQYNTLYLIIKVVGLFHRFLDNDISLRSWYKCHVIKFNDCKFPSLDMIIRSL
jgi:hypothetical protein